VREEGDGGCSHRRRGPPDLPKRQGGMGELVHGGSSDDSTREIEASQSGSWLRRGRVVCERGRKETEVLLVTANGEGVVIKWDSFSTNP
jgi:hypothetical protein